MILPQFIQNFDPYYYWFTVDRLKDADTMVGTWHKGCNDDRTGVEVRFNGGDSFELRTLKERPLGQEALELVEEYIQIGQKVPIKTIRDKNDNYGRLLANVFCVNDSGELFDIMEHQLKLNYAVPYVPSRAARNAAKKKLAMEAWEFEINYK